MPETPDRQGALFHNALESGGSLQIGGEPVRLFEMSVVPERAGPEGLPERFDRNRAVAAYAAEIRAFQTFFGVVVVALAAYHLLVLLPILAVGSSIPVTTAALAEAEQRARVSAEPQIAATATLSGIAQFRGGLASAHQRLYLSIAGLVAQGREIVGRRGNPYKALVKVPKEGANPAAGMQLEDVPVEEVIRRQIGRHAEALSVSLEAALEPLRALKNPPHAPETALRATQASVARDVVGLNQTLRGAFAADPNFWVRWRQDGGLGVASPETAQAVRRIEEGLNSLDASLAATATAWKGRQEQHQAVVSTLRARQTDLKERWAQFSRQFAWMPLGLHGALRLYPLIAGALALTLLVRLRRILALRRAHTGVDLDVLAPSWVVGLPSPAARLWAFILAAAPLAAALHASMAAAADRGLFVNGLGEYNHTMLIGYAATYAVLIVSGLVQLVGIARGLLAAPRRRPVATPSGEAVA